MVSWENKYFCLSPIVLNILIFPCSMAGMQEMGTPARWPSLGQSHKHLAVQCSSVNMFQANDFQLVMV